jgi:hypothetical protein
VVCEARAYGRICYVCNGSRSRLMHGSTRSFIRSVGVYNLAPLLAGGITSTWEAHNASAALSALPVTGGDLVLVGSER